MQNIGFSLGLNVILTSFDKRRFPETQYEIKSRLIKKKSEIKKSSEYAYFV